MDFETLMRISNIKTGEVENKLPRIHISSEGTLFQLMCWRNLNKDLVRNIQPIIKEGIISTITKKNYFYFLQSEEDEIYLMNKISNKEYVAFLYNKKDSSVTPIANNISFYSKEEAVQDILTVYATCMAYLREKGVTLKEREVFKIDKVKI
jgi:hypothetical protein